MEYLEPAGITSFKHYENDQHTAPILIFTMYWTVTLNHKNLCNIDEECKCKTSSNSANYVFILYKRFPCQWPSTGQNMLKITLWTSKEIFNTNV